MKQTIELESGDRVMPGLSADWGVAILEIEQRDGTTAKIQLTQQESFTLAGNLQGNACLIKLPTTHEIT